MISPKKKYRVILKDENKLDQNSSYSNREILEKILKNRSIDENSVDNFLENSDIDSVNPYELKDMDKVIKLLSDFIVSKKTIGIYGDFDADGLTGSAILIETFKDLGANPKPFIPHREDEGHGISKNGLKSLIDLGCELIITVDTGTNAQNLIKESVDNKVKIIITDHHIPESNSMEYLTLNPMIQDNITEYSGAGVAWLLSKALYKHFKKPIKDGITSLAAIGTVADVAPLTNSNRIIVKSGLKEISETKHFGINALNKISNKRFFHETPESEYISFYLAPRINTPGRIGDAYIALNLLTAQNEKEANNLSENIEKLNFKRRELSQMLWDKIQSEIEKQNSESLIRVDCTGYPLGLLGPLAGRLVESLSKPVFCFLEKDNILRFSSRSTENFNLFENLKSFDKYFLNFGGHSKAAGFSIKKGDYNVLFDGLLNESFNNKKKQESIKEYKIDIELSINQLNYNLWKDLKKLSPYGEKNPNPIFLCKNIELQNIKKIGKNKNHISGRLVSKNQYFDFIGFNNNFIPDYNKKIDCIFQLRTDLWNGVIQKKLQLLEIENSRI